MCVPAQLLTWPNLSASPVRNIIGIDRRLCFVVCFVVCRDGDINQLRSEIHEVLGNRNVSDEKFQAVVLDEIASLKVRSWPFQQVG